MTKILESKLYICVDPLNNNNKFWKYERYAEPITEGGESGDLKIIWGRVGALNPESQLRAYDPRFLARKIREKQGKEYTEAQVMDGGAPGKPKALAAEQVRRVAVQEIAGECKILGALVQRLAQANRHELLVASGGQLDIDLDTGMVRTPLGVVTSAAVVQARGLLDMMAPYVRQHRTDDPKYVDELQQYLRLVPQKVPPRRGWHTSFIVLDAQTQLLDQLETSVALAEQRIRDATTVKAAPDTARAFDVRMVVLEDAATITRIRKLYSTSGSGRHESSRLRPVRFYEVDIPHMAAAFQRDGAKIGNVKLLWHGTRMFNVLSILKRGFVLPHQLSTVQTTGAMYGPGLYFSAMSTKSLNYSYGYWDGGRREANCYMFLVDVAMGREYVPHSSGNGKRVGFDSCWAKPGQSGVINDEQIVYRTSQANIRYLVEFDA